MRAGVWRHEGRGRAGEIEYAKGVFVRDILSVGVARGCGAFFDEQDARHGLRRRGLLSILTDGG